MKSTPCSNLTDEDLLEPFVEDWSVLVSHLPNGWEAMARETKAIQRTRGFGTPEALLRTLLIHLAEGCSLRETAVRAAEGGIAHVSDVAILKRLRASEEWLRWLAVELAIGQDAAKIPDAGGKLRIRIVDATTVREPGSTGTDWRLHYALALKTLQCDFFELTDVHGAESLSRFPIERDDLILADRFYGTPKSVRYVVKQGGHALIRLRAKGHCLQRENGKSFGLLSALRRVRIGEVREWRVFMGGKNERPIAGRLCAIKRGISAARLAQRKIRVKYGKRGKAPSKLALETARYVFVFTTVSPSILSAAEALELYRGRWQIETCFKRLKSIMGFGHLPKHDARSCRAWLYGKLVVALLAEKLVDSAESFFPWGYDIDSISEESAA
jgi:hypothetical protein